MPQPQRVNAAEAHPTYCDPSRIDSPEPAHKAHRVAQILNLGCSVLVLPRLALTFTPVAMIESQRQEPPASEQARVQSCHLLLNTGDRPSKDHRATQLAI